MTDEVLLHRHGTVGHISLNRPKAIHALTQGMCEAMSEQLLAHRLAHALRQRMDRLRPIERDMAHRAVAVEQDLVCHWRSRSRPTIIRMI